MGHSSGIGWKVGYWEEIRVCCLSLAEGTPVIAVGFILGRLMRTVPYFFHLWLGELGYVQRGSAGMSSDFSTVCVGAARQHPPALAATIILLQNAPQEPRFPSQHRPRVLRSPQQPLAAGFAAGLSPRLPGAGTKSSRAKAANKKKSFARFAASPSSLTLLASPQPPFQLSAAGTCCCCGWLRTEPAATNVSVPSVPSVPQAGCLPAAVDVLLTSL